MAANQGSRLPRGQGRDALLEAAVRVVARKGLRGLTLRAVAAEAGVSHGLVTYLFKSRDRLLRETMKMAASQTGGTTLRAENAAVDRIRRQFPRSVTEHSELQAFQFELTLEACRQPEYRDEAVSLTEENVASVAAFLQAAGINRGAPARTT